jgi:RHS repeat-associated protein
MMMPGRNYSAVSGYRYGFNGKEKDNEVKGMGNQQDYGMRINDTRLGRFLSVDPITEKYPQLSPYQFASNTPIKAIDLDGLERLDMNNVNATARTATITVVKQVDIVRAGLAAELTALSAANFANIFTAGNTTVYTRTLPQNNQPIDYITQADFNNGTGFAIQVNYNVTLNYINTMAQSQHFLAERSVVFMAPATMNFSGVMAFATSGTASNDVAVNPLFDVFAVNSGLYMNETYEELLAHEVGFHNMMGRAHTMNAAGAAIYPVTNTLESNVHGHITPTLADTQELLRQNITNRGNLNVIPPPATAVPATTTPAPATTTPAPATISPANTLPQINLYNRPRICKNPYSSAGD